MQGLMIPISGRYGNSARGSWPGPCRQGGIARLLKLSTLAIDAANEPIGPLPATPTKARRVIRRPTMGKDQRDRAQGVTMIEMLIAMVILAVLMTIALPQFQNVLYRAQVARAIGDVRAIQTDLQTYETDGKGLPASLSEIGRGDMIDPWGNAFRYLRFPDDGKKPQGARKDRFLVPVNSTFDLYSVGKDGNTVAAMTAKAAQDDIVRANDGGFIGLASKF